MNLGTYWALTTITLDEDQIQLYQISQKNWYIIYNINLIKIHNYI
jgi:hypothetical protein